MQHIVDEDFGESSLKVYELVPARLEDEENSSTVLCKDTETYELVARVDESNKYFKPIELKTPISTKISSDVSETAIPIVLSDVNVSHMVSLTYPEKAMDESELLIKIVLTFSAMFKTLHEKNYDQLTRVLNRQAFDQACLDSEYFGASSNNNSISPFCVLAVIDLDNFKSINDQIGHAIGDEVLVLFCQTICSVIRDEDRFFRYGGEEFVRERKPKCRSGFRTL